MVHRANDSRLLGQVLKLDKEYTAALNSLLSSSQASLAALNAYASSCPPSHAQAMLGVVAALSGADEAFKAYAIAVDAWSSDLKRVRRSEDEVANILRDREILVGKLIKVSNKRSTRDTLAASFTTEPSLGLSSHATATGSTVTLTGGTAKLNHAQAELQACEAHLAVKEKELENTREETIKNGLQRRCKALVSCGWAFGERGKQALRALEGFGGEHANGDPHKLQPLNTADVNGSQLSSITPSLTPSQSASQIALPVTSDDSPNKSSSQHHAGSSSPVKARTPYLPEILPEPTFALEIGPPHSISDQGHIHDSVPSSRQVSKPSQKVGESSDDSIAKMPLEVHENKPFGDRSPDRPVVSTSRTHRAPQNPATRTLRRPAPLEIRESPRLGFPKMSSGSQSKHKHSSDLGPRNTYEAPSRSPREEGLARQGSISRKRSTSFSLLNGISGVFKSKKRSSSAERNAIPTSTGGWHTRTDKNLAHSRRGIRSSSSEEELPSEIIRKAQEGDIRDDNSSVTGKIRRLTKRASAQPPRRKTAPTGEPEGSKFTIIERPAREELVRRDSRSSKRSEKISSESGREIARETAVNTAVNSATSKTRRSSMPPERPSWEASSQGISMMNRLQPDRGTSALNTLENRTSELSKLSERLKRLEETDALLRTRKSGNDASSPLPTIQLELPKAPPSFIQPVEHFDEPLEISHAGERSASPRASAFKFPAESTSANPGSPRRKPDRTGSLDSYTQPAETPKSQSVIRSPSAAKDQPLKPALKSPSRGSATLPPLPSILVNSGHKRSQTLAGDNFQFSDRSGTISPPTPAGAREGLKANGDSLFIPKSNLSAGFRTPPVSPSIHVPTPRRLSEIPGSARNSMAPSDFDDSESIYESAEEELGDIEEEQEGTTTPPAGNALSHIFNRLRQEDPNGSLNRSTPLSGTENSHDGANVDAAASNSSTSTAQRRKSVRMIIYPTVAVAPPEQYDDELPTPIGDEASSPLSTTTSSNASTLRGANEGSRGGGWETRINANRNAWDNSSDEDEEYQRARRALTRAADRRDEKRGTRA